MEKNKVNERLRTSNTLLKKLNETYYVVKRGELNKEKNPDVYDVYFKINGGGINYFFTVIAKKTMKKSVLFNDKSYLDSDTLIKRVEEFNSTRPFPSKCYDPLNMNWANESMKIHWYLTNHIGMEYDYAEFGRDGRYTLRTAMGNEIMTLSFYMAYDRDRAEKDSTAGRLSRILNGGEKWIGIDFLNAEDAVSKINSFIAAELAEGINMQLDVLSRMTDSFNPLRSARIESLDSIIKGQSEKYRDKVLPILEKLIVEFKKGH